MESIFDVLRQYPALQFVAGLVLIVSLSIFAYLLIEYLNKKDSPAEEVVLPKPRLRVIVRDGQAVPVETTEPMRPVITKAVQAVQATQTSLYIPPMYSLEHAISPNDIVAEVPLPQAAKKIVLPSMPEDTPVMLRMPALPVKPMQLQPIVPQPTPERKKPSRLQKASGVITPQGEEQTSVVHIGYPPVNLFEQAEPMRFPYVLMPRAGSVVKYSRKGKAGRKRFMEAGFKSHIAHYFSNVFKVHDDHFILTKRNYQPLEPDLILVNETNRLNLFIAIEIDEPYEDNNAVSKREVCHYQYADVNTNRALVNRGWVVIRFAEIQVHRQPESCCLFIAHVIKSLWPAFDIPELLLDSPALEPLKQWTKEEAEQWSQEKYRENYLGISCFESFTENLLTEPVTETALGTQIEEEVQDEEPFFEPEPLDLSSLKAITAFIHSVIVNSQYISFEYEGEPCLVKPWIIMGRRLKAYCYLKNQNREFDVMMMKEIGVREKPFVLEAKGPALGMEKIKLMVSTAIQYNRYVRIRYTRSNWTSYLIDEAAGEVLLDEIEAEESLRTIHAPWVNGAEKNNPLQPADEDSLEAYCYKEEKLQTFRFNRICEMAVLNL